MADLFYRNRRLLFLVLALIAVGGTTALQVLPRTEDPRLTKRNALVTTLFPGANAERMEALVTEKVEERLEEIEEIKKLDSTSRAGISVVQIELRDEVNEREADETWSRIRDKIGEAVADLPPGALAPEFNEVDTEIDAYTVIAAFVWDSAEIGVRPHDVYESGVGYPLMRRLAEELEDELRGLTGTKQTKIFGDPDEEIRVLVRPERLADLGVTAAELSARIARTDSKSPAGQFRGASNDLLLEIEGELDSLDRVRAAPVASGPDGRVVRVADLGTVEKTVADPPSELAIINGNPGVAVAARMESGFRVDRWSAEARRVIDDFQAQTPAGVRLEILFDQSEYVESRLNGLAVNLVLAIALVMAIIAFLMGWRQALLIGSALPISALLALSGMRLIGLPIHQMSVTGLIVALGLLIDNAIVMVDEVRQRLDEGQPATLAVGTSVRHLAVPLLGSTLTTTFAFMPIALLPGGAGEFVGPISLAVILALISSLFAALTIVPALAGLFAEPPRELRRRAWWRDGFADEELGRSYKRLLQRAYERPALTIAIAVAPAMAGFAVQPLLQEQFFPPADRDQFQIQLRMPIQSSIEQTLDFARRSRDLLIKHEQIEDVHWFVGHNAPKFYYNMLGGDAESPFYAQALVSLRDNDGYFSLIRDIQRELDAAFPAAQFLALQLEQGPPFNAPIELNLSGPDLETLSDLGERFRAELSRTPGVTHTLTTLEDSRPKVRLGVDDEELRLAGLDNQGAAEQLRAALDGRLGGSLLEDTEELPVRVVLASAARGDLSEIGSLDLIGVGDNRAPLAALVDVEIRPELARITHKEGRRTNTVRGYIQSGLLPSIVLADYEERIAAVELPAGYSYSFGGEAEQRDDAVGNLMANVTLLIIAMVATLVLSFNSFRLAGVIGLVAGLSMGFAFLMLFLFQYPFGFVAIVGSMGLIGVAVNDSIVVMAALKEDSDASRGDVRAGVAVVVRATRHVIATTLTTMVGFTPLLLSGGDFWPPLAVSIGAGVIGATILALFFVPAAYLAMARRRCRLEARQAAAATA